jgi:hypothetical protein
MSPTHHWIDEQILGLGSSLDNVLARNSDREGEHLNDLSGIEPPTAKSSSSSGISQLAGIRKNAT